MGFRLLAYQKVCVDEMGAYMPWSSIQRSAFEDFLALRNAVLDTRFMWGARLDFFIKSPNNNTDYGSLSKRKIKRPFGWRHFLGLPQRRQRSILHGGIVGF